jgi:hypothetical protein
MVVRRSLFPGFQLRIRRGHLELVRGKDIVHRRRRLIYIRVGSTQRKLLGCEDIDRLV